MAKLLFIIMMLSSSSALADVPVVESGDGELSMSITESGSYFDALPMPPSPRIKRIVFNIDEDGYTNIEVEYEENGR